MSTKITTIYADLVTALDTAFSATHKKMANPYLVEDNDDKTLNRGYGFYFSGSSNTQRQVGCQLSIKRTLVFINTIVNRGTENTTTLREAAETQLLEDQIVLIKAVENIPTIGTVIAKILFISDNGIERIYGEDNNYLMIQTNYELEYLDDIT